MMLYFTDELKESITPTLNWIILGLNGKESLIGGTLNSILTCGYSPVGTVPSNTEVEIDFRSFKWEDGYWSLKS